VSPPVLAVEGISRRFGAAEALAPVSFRLDTGSVLAVMGPNGAGKSTLVDLLSGYLRPTAGLFRLDGVDRTAAPRWELARAGVGRSFQVPRPLLRFSVAENVHVAAVNGRRPRLERRAAAALTAELLELLGLSRLATRRAGELPVGALRRLELARALALRPRLLLLDEPLAGLAPEETALVTAVLAQVATAERAVLIVEHGLRSVLPIADRVAFLHHGQLLRLGPPADVLADPAVVEAYLGGRLARLGLL